MSGSNLISIKSKFGSSLVTLNVEVLLNNFEEKVKQLWYDPFDKPVAVAMFDKPIAIKFTEKELLELDQKVILGISRPTWSVIVQLHNKPVYSKLPKILEHKFQCKVDVKKMFTPTCCEIVCPNGWDDVVTLCHKKWRHDREIISVVPFFECFKEDFYLKDIRRSKTEEQLALSTYNESLGAASEPPRHSEKCSFCLNDSANELSHESIIHSFFSVLLDALNFSSEKTLIQIGVKVCIHLENFTIYIHGPELQVKEIMDLIKKKSFKLIEHSNEMNQFMKENTIQQQIKDLITEQNFKIIFDSDPFDIFVKDRNGHKIQLKDVLVHKIFPTLPKELKRNRLENLKHEIENKHKNFRVFHTYKAVVFFGVKEHISDDTDVHKVTESIKAHLQNVSSYSYEDSKSDINKHIYSKSLVNRSDRTHERGKFQINIKYPGLISFLSTPEGNEILTNLLAEHKIPLDFVNNDQSSPDFKFVILNKAKINSCVIQLVQGSIQDVKVCKKIIFLPCDEDGDCHLKDGQCEQECNLILPPWRSFEKDFSRLRTSLHKALNEIIQIIDSDSYTDVAFSTSKVHSAEFPFPLDLIAKSILEAISQKRSAGNMSRFCNIYIIDSQSCALFKAFQYFIKKISILEVPDNDTWSKISSAETTYDPITAWVEVQTNSLIKKKNCLYCYPVDPSLKWFSTPVKKEKLCCINKLKNSVKQFKNEAQSGLLAGNICHINCFVNNAPVLLYSIPPWGPDCHKAIQDAFSSCIQECSKFKTVYIVPPGLHTTPKFPKVYLAQTVCKVLHQLMIERSFPREKHLVLVVNDSEYKQAFERELNKYFVNSGKKQITLINFQAESHSSNEFIIKGNSEECLQSFKLKLCEKLNKILEKNNIEIRLNRNQLLMYKEIFKDAEDMNVCTTLKEIYTEQRSSESKFKVAGISTGAILRIQGFRRKWIEDLNVFLSEIASNIPRQHYFSASCNDLNCREEDE